MCFFVVFFFHRFEQRQKKVLGRSRMLDQCSKLHHHTTGGHWLARTNTDTACQRVCASTLRWSYEYILQYMNYTFQSMQFGEGGALKHTERQSEGFTLTNTHTHIWHWLRLTDWPMATDQFKSKNKKKRGMVLTTKEKRHGLSAPRPSEICFLCCYI